MRETTSHVAAGALDPGKLLVRIEQLELALTSRIAIDTAVGVLVERYDLRRDQAFELLRRAARHHRRRIHDLADAVTASRTETAEILAILQLRDGPRKTGSAEVSAGNAR